MPSIYKQAQLESPNIVVQPTEGVVQKAVNLLKKMDPNYFVGIKQINLNSSTSNYGFVESGENKDPTVVNVNFSKIKQHAGSQESPELIAETAITIAHECAHVKSYKEGEGFVGGESPAEQEEKKVSDWIKNNIDKLKTVLASNSTLLKIASSLTDHERRRIHSKISEAFGLADLANKLQDIGYDLGKRFDKNKFYILKDGENCFDFYIKMLDFTTFRTEKFPEPKIVKERKVNNFSNQMTAYDLWDKENN